MENIIRRKMNILERIPSALLRESTKFGAVGAMGWVVDNGIYALLHTGPMHGSTLKARVVSSSIAIIFSWFANRYWTFRHSKGDKPWREFVRFVAISLTGLSIALLCQFISHYVMGLQSLTADIISGGVVGLALGMIFRFYFYKVFVFSNSTATNNSMALDKDLAPVGDR